MVKILILHKNCNDNNNENKNKSVLKLRNGEVFLILFVHHSDSWYIVVSL